MKIPQDLDKPVLYSRKLMQIQIERDVEGPERWIAKLLFIYRLQISPLISVSFICHNPDKALDKACKQQAANL